MSRNKPRLRRVVRDMITKMSATPEQLRARLELRRSSAASPHRSKKVYNRKAKHPKKEF